MTATPTPTPDSPPRAKKRIYIPLILLLLFLGIGVVFFIRGVWADTVEKNPAGPEAGTQTQLLKKANGNVVVRCAVVVDAPPAEVWAVVSGYSKHAGLLPYVTRLDATTRPDGKIQLEGIASSRVWGEWPFESLVTHEEHPGDAEYFARWSQENEGVYAVNRGGWSVTPFDGAKKQTLLVFHLQIELKDYPSFIVRNIVMDRVHTILQTVRDETLRRKRA